MYDLIETVLAQEEQGDLLQLVATLKRSGKQYFLRNEILQVFSDYCRQTQKPNYFFHTSALGKLVHLIHELILVEDRIWVVVRPWFASQEVWSLKSDLTELEQRTPQALLRVRDSLLVRRDQGVETEPQVLEIDMQPFYENLPTIHDPRSIGQGLEFLNRQLCNQVLTDPHYWLDALFRVLQGHEYDGKPLMINEQI
jgi:sucrose synthase